MHSHWICMFKVLPSPVASLHGAWSSEVLVISLDVNKKQPVRLPHAPNMIWLIDISIHNIWIMYENGMHCYIIAWIFWRVPMPTKVSNRGRVSTWWVAWISYLQLRGRTHLKFLARSTVRDLQVLFCFSRITIEVFIMNYVWKIHHDSG